MAGKKPGVAPSLTRDQIAGEALALADEVGLENVSIRRLAARLGCAPMALYTYFDSVQRIREAVVALAFREVDTAPVPGERWDDTLRRTTSSIREMYLRHADANLQFAEEPGYSDGLAEHTSKVYRLHGEQGIPPAILRKAWRIIDAFLGGFIAAELCELRERPVHPDPQGRDWMETAETAYSEETFHDGIEIIIAGIRGLAAPDPCLWTTPAQGEGREAE